MSEVKVRVVDDGRGKMIVLRDGPDEIAVDAESSLSLAARILSAHNEIIRGNECRS